MKKIIIIDDSELFRDFLSAKLKGYGFEVTQAINGFDGIMKMRQTDFDLIIMDYYLSRNSSIEVLEAKRKNPNSRDTPVIMASAKIDKNSLLQVSQFGVQKFFTKPLKIDALVKALSDLLHVKIEVDTTPCIIDAHYNDGIIFVEIAQGLNWDKLELLKFRLKELLELHKIMIPKILVLLSAVEIGANDSLQLASLMSILTEHTQAKPIDIKLLTTSEFIKGFLKRKPALAGIEVVDTLNAAMDGLTGSETASGQFLAALSKSDHSNQSGFNLRFEAENASSNSDSANLRELGDNIAIGIVDDDFVIREIIKKAFSETGIRLHTFVDGADFLQNSQISDFDLVFLDLLMPNTDGFQVLQILKEQGAATPIIVLSALSQRDTVVKALGFGVKSYIIKPVQPEAVCRKAIEVLRMNF